MRNSFYTHQKKAHYDGAKCPRYAPDNSKFAYTIKNLEFAKKTHSWQYLSVRQMHVFVNNCKLINLNGEYLAHKSVIKFMSPKKAKLTINNTRIANHFASWHKLTYKQMQITVKYIDLINLWNSKNDYCWTYLNFLEMSKIIKTLKQISIIPN
jgi:hypothetical protein